MDLSLVVFAILVILYVGALLYIANQDDLERSRAAAPPGETPPGTLASLQRAGIIRVMIYGLVGLNGLFGLLILQLALFASSIGTRPSAEIELPRIDPAAAIIYCLVALMVSFTAGRAVVSDELRGWIQQRVVGSGVYRADSSVHLVALVLALVFFSITLGQLVLTGGLAGLAQDIQNQGISLNELAFQTLLLTAASFLGVGLAIRRTPAECASRLGLRWPTAGDLGWGIGIGLLLYLILVLMVTVWATLVSPEQLQQQSAAADQIARAFNTLPLALVLAAAAAVSEEILFRGALQPVFGLGATSIFFALVHMQYTLTPATLIIFVVALGLGWLRQRHSTTAAIIAHFVYNFVQLALAILAASALNAGT